MKILESNNRFKVLSERFIGVHTIKEKAEGTSEFWQIFDAETLTLFPQTFKGLKSFSGECGIVQDFAGNLRYVFVNEFNDLVVDEKEYKDCSNFVNDIAVVRDFSNNEHFVKLENHKIERISPDFVHCFLPKENLAPIKVADSEWHYARVSKNGFKLLKEKFLQIHDFNEGYGRVQGYDERYRYVFCVNDQIIELPHNFKYCYPIKDGIARIQNDDLTMYYAKLHGEDINILSKDYKYAFEFNEGVARVINDDDSVSFLQKKDDKLAILGTKEYNENLNMSHPKYSFPNAEDFSENVCTTTNKDETISFGIRDNNGGFKTLPAKYKNAGKVIGNVARVEFLTGEEGYVVFDENGVVSVSDKFAKARDFHCGVGLVKNPYGTETYVKVKDGYVRNFASNYLSCIDYDHNFGVVKNSETKYAVLDINGLPLVKKENLREAVENNKKYAKFYGKKLLEIEAFDKKKQEFIEAQYIREI